MFDMHYFVYIYGFMLRLNPLKPIQDIKTLHLNYMLGGSGIKQAPLQYILSSRMCSLATQPIVNVTIFTHRISEVAPFIPTSSNILKNIYIQNLYQFSYLEYSAFMSQRDYYIPIVLDTREFMLLITVMRNFIGNFQPASISEVSGLAHKTCIFG